MNIFKRYLVKSALAVIDNASQKTRSWAYSQGSYNLNYETYVAGVYNNPAVQSALTKMLEAFVNIGYRTTIRTTITEKGVTKVTTQPSNNPWVERTLAKPCSLTNRIEFLEYLLFYYIFGGLVTVSRTTLTSRYDLVMYAPNQVSIYYNADYMRVDSVQLGRARFMGEALDNIFFMKSVDPAAAIAGKSQGHSRIAGVAAICDLVNFILKHNNNLLKNSGNMSGFITAPSSSIRSTNQKDELLEKFNAAVAGYEKAGKHAILPEGANFVQTSINPRDLDWNNGLITAYKMIGNIMGVPFSMIWDNQAASNNLEGDKLRLYKNTLIPIAKKVAALYNEIFKDVLADNEYIEIDLSGVEELQKDTLAIFAQFTTVSYMTVNEKRETVGNLTGIEMAPYPHENADKIYMQGSEVPIDDDVVEVTNETP